VGRPRKARQLTGLTGSRYNFERGDYRAAKGLLERQYLVRRRPLGKERLTRRGTATGYRFT
jgi:hypothetical protein